MIIAIDGNIGVGKTTVINELVKLVPGSAPDLEPVEKWEPYLHQLYNHHQGAFSFQTRVWLDRCWPHKPSEDTNYLWMERSPSFTRKVFIEGNKEFYSPLDYKTIHDLYDLTESQWFPDLIVYLSCPPEISYHRTQNRNRASERHIQLDYIQKIHDLHEAGFKELQKANPNSIVRIPVEYDSPSDVAHKILQHVFSRKPNPPPY